MDKKIVKEYLSIAIGAFLLAVGMNMFLVPLQLSSGGIGTIGTVLLYVFQVPLSITSLVLNSVLFVFGYKLLGKDAIIKRQGFYFYRYFLRFRDICRHLKRI